MPINDYSRDLANICDVNYNKENNRIDFKIPYLHLHMAGDYNYIWNNDDPDGDYIAFDIRTTVKYQDGTEYYTDESYVKSRFNDWVFIKGESSWGDIAHLGIQSIVHAGPRGEGLGNGNRDVYFDVEDWWSSTSSANHPYCFYVNIPKNKRDQISSINLRALGYYYAGQDADGSDNYGYGDTGDYKYGSANFSTVTYHPNGAESSSMPTNTVRQSGKRYYVTSIIPQRPGYTFLGWSGTEQWDHKKNLYHPGSMAGGIDWDYTKVDGPLNFYAQWLPNIATGVFKNFIPEKGQDIWLSKPSFEHNVTFNNKKGNDILPNFPENLNNNKVGTCGGWLDIKSNKIYSNEDKIPIPICDIIYTPIDDNHGTYKLKEHIYTFRPIWITLENPKTKVTKYINNQYTIAVIFEMTAKIFMDNINNIEYIKNPIGNIYCEQLDKNSKQVISQQIYSPKDYYFNPYGINYVSFIFEKNKITEQDLVNLLFTAYYQINAYSTKKLNFSINLLDIIQAINIKVPDTTTCLKIPKTEKSTITKIHIKC